jgi:prevent-host-death family protein
MITLNINKAKANLSKVLAKAAKGETVVLCKRNKPVAEICPIRMKLKNKRPIGSAVKEYPNFSLGKDFFSPLPDDLVDAFSCKNT